MRSATAELLDFRAAGMRLELARVKAEIAASSAASQTYIDLGVQILDLAQRASALFENQPPKEKRRLLNFVLSNCTWKDGHLTAHYRKPFDQLDDQLALAMNTATQQATATDWP